MLQLPPVPHLPFTDVPFSGRFVLHIDNQLVGSFRECTGLAVEVEMQEIKEGGQNEFVHLRPGRLKWPHLTFKRGITHSDGLFNWITEASGRSVAGGVGVGGKRSTGAVWLLNSMRVPVRRWSFIDAIPVKWKGPDLTASATDVAMEELEVAHHGFTVEGLSSFGGPGL